MGFDNLIGNNRVKKILKAYISLRKIPQSIIFYGDFQDYLLKFAKGFVKALNCNNLENDFCNTCDNCRAIEENRFLDSFLLQPEGVYYKKDSIMRIIEESRKRPYSSEYKIFTFLDAHKMNVSSANSFLKVLEESLETNIFILITNNLNGIITTIKSRCQIIKFSRLTVDEISEYLIESGFNQKESKLLARLSEGNIENLLKNDFNSLMNKRHKTLLDLEKLLKKTHVEDILLDLYSKTKTGRKDFLQDFKEMVNLISFYLRDIMLFKINGNPEMLINIDYKDKLKELSDYISLERVVYLIKSMELLFRDIERNLNTKVLTLKFIENFTIGENNV